MKIPIGNLSAAGSVMSSLTRVADYLGGSILITEKGISYQLPEKLKTCSVCKKDLPISEFYIGYNQCKLCKKAKTNERQQRIRSLCLIEEPGEKVRKAG